MFFWNKKRKNLPADGPPPAVRVTLEEVKRAVLKYEMDMPKGINRKTLVLPDKSLDLSRLVRYLGGISEQKFYLSSETFEIFEEQDREIPYYLDIVQRAVDSYMEESGRMPVVKQAPPFQVDIKTLMEGHFLKEAPPFPLYITDQEMLLTHRREVV